ncbi:MAG: hypothetical protein JSR34_05740 [Proteobacteria bacterium]|nr:hypothetical protein [Pseudomonadota bacterium]
MRWLRTAWLATVCALAALAARAAEPVFTRLTPDVRVYPQFFSIAQDRERQIYVGGTDGIVRNDGGRWIWQPSPKPGPVRALQADASGRIWYGGSDSFGYLQPLPTGEQRYVDLAPQFARDLRGAGFSDIWRIGQWQGLTWFQALHDVFAVDAQGRRIGHWHREQRFGFVGSVRGQLWLQWRGEGMRCWDGHDFVAVPGTQMYAGALIYDMFALPDGAVLVHDAGKGLSIWRDGVASTLDDASLQDDITHLQTGIALDADRYAFASDDGRVRILDLQRRRIASVPIGNGFGSAILRDRDGALLTVDNLGMARMPWPPHWWRYGAADGVIGDVHALSMAAGRLFLCGSAGVQENASADGAPAPSFLARRWTKDECWQVLADSNGPLLADSRALLRVDGAQATPVSTDDLYPRALLLDPSDPGRLWVGTEHGAALFVRGGTGWRQIGRRGETGWRFSTVVPAAQGVWFGSDNHGLYLARADAHAPQGFTLEAWGVDRGLLAGDDRDVQVSALPEGVYASTSRGLFRFAQGRFVKDDAGGLAELLSAGETVRLLADADGERWAFSYHSVYRRPTGGGWQVAWIGNPALGAIESMLILPGGDALVGASGQMLRFDNGAAAAADTGHADVRVTGMRLNREGRPAELLPLDRTPHIMPRGGSIDLDLGYTDYAAGADKQYQVRLEGLSHGWSDWSRQASYRVGPAKFTQQPKPSRTVPTIERNRLGEVLVVRMRHTAARRAGARKAP